jgi:outer membrane protein
MKKLFDVGIKVLLATGLIVLFALRSDSRQELVYVDSKKLLLGYKGMEKAKASFEIKASRYRSNLDSLRTELEELIGGYEKQKKSLPAIDRKKNEDLIASKQQQYMGYEQNVNESLKKEDDALTVEVMGKINEYLRKYGREKGYRIILAATLYGNIAYADESTDITDDVLKGLNEAYK